MLDAAPVREGDVLAGKYRVERVLGIGGMGVVVAAIHIALGQRVALKFMLPAALTNLQAIGRFVREGRALARLRSEHVARVIDVGTLEDGAPFIVMEFLDGSDLDAIVKRHGPLAVATAVEYILQACEGIAEAHASGLVHRDLKPGNLFLTRKVDGQPLIKVLDFGITKDTSEEPKGVSLTQTAAVLGSPQFMSPEQLKSSRDVDARTDVWALGASLYALLSGTLPFDAASFAELSAKVLIAAPHPLRGLRPDASPALEAVVLRCLEKEPSARFSDVAALAGALEPFAPPACRGAAQRIMSVLSQAAHPRISIASSGVSGDPRLASNPTEASNPELRAVITVPEPAASSGPTDAAPLVVTVQEEVSNRHRTGLWVLSTVVLAVSLVGVLVRGHRPTDAVLFPVSASGVAAHGEPAAPTATTAEPIAVARPPVVGVPSAEPVASPPAPVASKAPPFRPATHPVNTPSPKAGRAPSPDELLMDRN